MNSNTEYEFMKFPIALRSEGRLVCLDNNGYTRAVSGLESKALKCGTCGLQQWLLTDNSLIIYGFPAPEKWIIKDISNESGEIESIETSYDEVSSITIYALCYRDDLHVIKLQGASLQEFLLPGIHQVGGVFTSEKEQCFVVHNGQFIEQIYLENGDLTAARILEPEFDHSIFKRVFVSGYSEHAVLDVDYVESHMNLMKVVFFTSSTFLVIGYPPFDANKSMTVAFILINSDARKTIELELKSVKILAVLELSKSLVLFYFYDFLNDGVLCVKLDKGSCYWAECLLDSKAFSVDLKIDGLQYSKNVGVYGIVDDDSGYLVISKDGLEFKTAHFFNK